MDPVNPSCPKELNWSTYRQMRFTLDTSNGLRVLRAEGLIDEDMPARLGDAEGPSAGGDLGALPGRRRPAPGTKRER